MLTVDGYMRIHEKSRKKNTCRYVKIRGEIFYPRKVTKEKYVYIRENTWRNISEKYFLP